MRSVQSLVGMLEDITTTCLVEGPFMSVSYRYDTQFQSRNLVVLKLDHEEHEFK